MTTEMTVEQAVDVIRRDYDRDVLSMARNMAERMKSGDVEDFNEALHEVCDDCPRVIFTFHAKLGLLASENAGAFEEVGVDATEPSVMMYFALRQDIIDRLEVGGVDVNDEKSWAEIDLKAFES